MNEQLTLQSTQHEETKTVPLRRRKACLAGTFALFAACALVLLIPHPAYAGIIGDFLDIPNMIKTWLLQIAATLFNTYFGVINQTLDAKFISGPFNELFGTTEPYGVVKDFYQAGVIPVAHAILGLFMLMQLIKISQRIDATSTLPAVKDIVFLVVTYCILSYFIDNALDLVSAIYSIFNDLVGNVSDKLQSKNWYEPGIEMTKDDAADATFGGCFLLLIFGLISWAVGLVFYAVSMVVALGRSVQLYVYAAFSPIPISLLGFEETKQIGIGYLKNFAAAALAGVVMVLILYLYPHLVTALAVSGGLGKAEMLGLAQGVETFDSFGVIIKTTIQDFEERIEKQKAELAKLEAKKKELEKKIRERNRKWRSLVTHSAGESVLSAVGCAWQELDLDALDRFLASHADEVSDMLTAHGSTPEDAKARLDARKKKTVKTEPVADGGLQAAEPDSENSDW